MPWNVKKGLIAAIAAGLLIAGPSIGYAAQQGGQSGAATSAQAQKPVPHYSQQKLEHFAAAFNDIKGIQKKLTHQLKGAKNKKQAQKMQQQAMHKMVKAVQSHHLTAKQYNKIAINARRDSKLRSRIMKLVQGS